MAANRAARPSPTARVLLLLTFGGGLLASCDKLPLLAPSGTAITLIAATNVLPVNGSVEIIAILTEGGQSQTGQQTQTTPGVGSPVHNGTVVTFATTLGRIEPAEAKTSAGRATVRLVADGRSGTAVITAFSGPASKTLEVKIGSAGAARVLVTANPQSLPATGGTSTIQARVEDQQGNGLLGVPVSFSTTAGTLAATSALSNEQGFALTTLTTTAAATVTASAGGGTTGTLSGTVALTLAPRTTITITPPATATVSVPASFQIGVGTNTIVTDAVVDFGDGDKVSLGAISSSTNVIHLFGSSGTFTVSVTATDSTGAKTTASTQVAVVALTATGFASPVSAAVGLPITFTVTVVPSSASIDRFEWNFGDGFAATTSSNQMNHAFATEGTKTVTVRVVPTKGPTLTVLIQCQVTPGS